jgi:hypothetical protein
MAMDGVFNNLTPGSSYWDPEHMSFGDGGEGKLRVARENGDRYHAGRDEFARVHHLNLSAGHPQLHGGHRTAEDIKNDLDAGHKIMGNGQHAVNRMLGKTSAWDPQNEHRVKGLHQDALEAGYAANSHIYSAREAKAKREAERPAPTQTRSLWDDSGMDDAPKAAPAAAPKAKPKTKLKNDNDTLGGAIKHVIGSLRKKG